MDSPNSNPYPIAGLEKGERLDDIRLTIVGPFVWLVGLAILVSYATIVRPLDSFTIRDASSRGTSGTASSDRPPPAPSGLGSITLSWGRPTAADHPTKALPHRQTLLWLIFAHWLPIGAFALLILIVVGRVGVGLGLPGLFRDPPRPDFAAELLRRREASDYAYGRGNLTAFLGAVGATFLIAEIWTVIFYLEVVENFEALGVVRYFEGTSAENPFATHADLRAFLIACCKPCLALLLLAGVFPARAPGIERRGEEFWKGCLRFLLGIVVGSGIVLVAMWFGSALHEPFEAMWRRAYPAIEHLSEVLGSLPILGNQDRYLPLLRIQDRYPVQPGAPSPGGPGFDQVVIVMASFSAFFAVAIFIYAAMLAILAWRKRNLLSPGLAICMLLGFAVLGYAFLAMLSTVGQVSVVSLTLLWMVFANGGRYKYRFPGMESYYRKGGLVTQEKLVKALEPGGQNPHLLRNREVLDNWKRAASRPGEGLPKLILIATTGGAYRAAFWTSVVLDELGRHLGSDFFRHIRLITGASGGMVGAAYYVSEYDESGPPSRSVTDLMRDETGLDSLTPVIRRLVVGDLPLGLWPSPQAVDRGVVLEREWKSLAKTFPELGEGERAGWRPSLIVSPMVVESGRRMLLSNLDLGSLAETRPLGPDLSPGPSSPEAVEARLYSSSAVEFFRVFPEARPTFSLQTAIRMSATFPLASPAVGLPTDPARRVVDAGYYDNYGVDLATSWAYQYQDWIRENTSGMALIQLRAYPSENDIRTYFGLAGATHRGPVDRAIGRVATSFQGLTSPLYGGMSAREGSMRFRNASQVRILDDVFNRGGTKDFFETFVFENYADFAMNWFISEQDIASMKQSIGAPSGGEAPPTVDEESVDAVLPETPARNAIKAARVMCKDNNVEFKEKLRRWYRG